MTIQPRHLWCHHQARAAELKGRYIGVPSMCRAFAQAQHSLGKCAGLQPNVPWLMDGLFRADSTFSLWNVQFCKICETKDCRQPPPAAKFCPNRNQPDVVLSPNRPNFVRTRIWPQRVLSEVLEASQRSARANGAVSTVSWAFAGTDTIVMERRPASEGKKAAAKRIPVILGQQVGIAAITFSQYPGQYSFWGAGLPFERRRHSRGGERGRNG
ncbi:hypothetical protein B0H10DRAFT_1943679 [Mycena sp. CBHHK59/15]|nr:hypothetical protein B0H10DRAFT_1943679 [Mycena sp. CBHHK59/15]